MPACQPKTRNPESPLRVPKKTVQLSISSHNKPLSVAAFCFGNPDRSSPRIDGCHTAPTPSGFAEIVGDDFPRLHAAESAVSACQFAVFSDNLPLWGMK